ncbi:MAG: alpha/beta fold hydrolase [Bacteroidota bacterium]|nr:alpha/beta fold hydrolase [Bacteroidota bacterium]
MKLFFREEGEGFPIVIVHGLYGSSDNWLTVGKKLSARFKVYMIDQRNHGRSPNSEEHSYEALKNDLAEFFDQHKIEKAIVMGHSMGGKTAMCFAADYPERIEKLIVVDIAPKNYFLLNDESQYFLHKNILQAMLEIEFSRMESRKEVENYLLQ